MVGEGINGKRVQEGGEGKEEGKEKEGKARKKMGLKNFNSLNIENVGEGIGNHSLTVMGADGSMGASLEKDGERNL